MKMAESFPEARRAFHPCDPPRGMQNYDLGCLTEHQKRILNGAKMSQRKENEIYLNAHPEIAALISIVLRHVLQLRPVEKVHETIGQFFQRPRETIGLEVIRYLSSVDCSFETIERLRRQILREKENESSSSDKTDDP